MFLSAKTIQKCKMKNKKSAAFSFETRRILNYGVKIVSFLSLIRVSFYFATTSTSDSYFLSTTMSRSG